MISGNREFVDAVAVECSRGAVLLDYAPTVAVLERDERPVRHWLHLLLTVLTLFWWLPIYWLVVVAHRVTQVRLTDRDGRVERALVRCFSSDRGGPRALSAVLLLPVGLTVALVGVDTGGWLVALGVATLIVAIGSGIAAVEFTARDRRRTREAHIAFDADRTRLHA